jgi:hypothetical protein
MSVSTSRSCSWKSISTHMRLVSPHVGLICLGHSQHMHPRFWQIAYVPRTPSIDGRCIFRPFCTLFDLWTNRYREKIMHFYNTLYNTLYLIIPVRYFKLNLLRSADAESPAHKPEWWSHDMRHALIWIVESKRVNTIFTSSINDTFSNHTIVERMMHITW